MSGALCPDCDKPLRGKGNRCASCGWVKPGYIERDAVRSSRWRKCRVHFDGRDCPAPPVSDVGGDQYCSWHNPTQSVPEQRMVLKDLIENGLPRIIDWRDYFCGQVQRGVDLEQVRAQWHEMQKRGKPAIREPGEDG